MKPGPKNLITDVAGLRVGNAENHRIKTGVTVLAAEAPFVASVDVMGGSPGSRETDLLSPDRTVEAVDALVLSGGSAFGLDAASGVADALAEAGRGFAVGAVRVPIVPGAIIFDLLNGGDKQWGANPYRDLGRSAYENLGEEFALGSTGAGTGATTAGLKGGLGSASLVLDNGVTVGALVAANPTGQVVNSEEGHFWAAPFEMGEEFGGAGVASKLLPAEFAGRTKADFARGLFTNERANTTIAIVSTDAQLTKAQARRVAVAAQDGIARAILPAHTPVDGDLVFAVSTGARALVEPLDEVLAIGHAAAVCLSRAIARAVYEAVPGDNDLFPTWRERFRRGS